MWLLAACTSATSTADTVAWAGWVYTDGQTVEEAKITDGAVTVWPEPPAADGQIAAAQPYPDYPGYWSADVPPSTPVNVRITAPNTRPTVWAGDTPAADGSWFSGALFGASDRWLEDVFDALLVNGDEWVAVPLRGDVLVLGQPVNDEVLCEDLLVDGVHPSCWRVGDDGAPEAVQTGPVTWFAASAAPGAVELQLGASVETWYADGGDVVMAWYLSEAE